LIVSSKAWEVAESAHTAVAKARGKRSVFINGFTNLTTLLATTAATDTALFLGQTVRVLVAEFECDRLIVRLRPNDQELRNHAILMFDLDFQTSNGEMLLSEGNDGEQF